MRDELFQPLRTVPMADTAAEPLPAAEVRRRGDRRRRRRTALQLGALAAAVAVIAGGAVGVAGRLDPREAPPIHPPQETDGGGPAPRIRADFPLAAGWPDPGGDGRRTKPSRSVAQIEWFRCGIDKVSGFGDRLGTEQVIGDAGYGRDLYTFGSEPAAAAAYASLRGQLEACRTWQDENGATYSAAPRTPGAGSSFQLAEWNEAVYAGAVLVARDGRALLVDVAGTEGHGRQRAEQVAADQRRQVAPVVAAMCEFSSTGCARTPDARLGVDDLLTRADLVAALDAHPLAEGPTTVDWRPEQLRDVLSFGCGHQVSDLRGSTDVLSRDWTGAGVEGAEVRTVVALAPDQDTGRRIFDRATRQLTGCAGPEARLAAGAVQGTDGTEDGSAWRIFTADAPEVCTECDTRQLIGMGVAKVGRKVVLVTLSVRVDVQLADLSGAWFGSLMDRAVARIS